MNVSTNKKQTPLKQFVRYKNVKNILRDAWSDLKIEIKFVYSLFNTSSFNFFKDIKKKTGYVRVGLARREFRTNL